MILSFSACLDCNIILGICHHSRLPPAGTEAAAGDAAGLGDAGDAATDGDAACSNSEEGDPALESRIYILHKYIFHLVYYLNFNMGT